MSLSAGLVWFGLLLSAADMNFSCQPQVCSDLAPASAPESPASDDCAYRNGNQWWLDSVAGSLAWNTKESRQPITVAVFDDGADIDHVELRDQLWTNEREAAGKPGIDDDANGYIDDVHGWDFVDNDAIVAPEGACRGRPSHGTFMSSLIAGKRNNAIGIASAGSDAARLMILRITGCGRQDQSRFDPVRMQKALAYATGQGAKLLSFSNHWYKSTPELDAAFARIADAPDAKEPAVIVASIPNKGEPLAGYPAAYPFRRIVRAVPIGNHNEISPGTSVAPIGLNLGSPSACVMGATVAPDGFGFKNGSSNSTAILSGVLAGIWSSPAYAKFDADQFVAIAVRGRMVESRRRSQAGSRWPYDVGVPLLDACILESVRETARVCRLPLNTLKTDAHELQ